MAISVSQQCQLIILEVGDLPDSRLRHNIQAIWDDYADKGALNPRLQVLYTTWRCLKLVTGYYRDQVNFEVAGGVTMMMDQRFKHLQSMITTVEADIALLEKKVRGSRPGASAELTTRTPESPPWPSPPYPDANAKRLRGDPYRRPLFGRDSGLP